MKATGIVRRIDDLGRVVIPKAVREEHGIAENDPLEIFTSKEGIMFKKYDDGETVERALKHLETAVRTMGEVSYRSEFLKTIHELKNRLKAEKEADHE